VRRHFKKSSLVTAQINNLSYIYLGYFVCLCVIECVCVSQLRNALLEERTEERGIKDGEIREGEIEEEGYEETFHCLI
jgi:hypothetical protein